jgi:hypothetical protein
VKYEFRCQPVAKPPVPVEPIASEHCQGLSGSAQFRPQLLTFTRGLVHNADHRFYRRLLRIRRTGVNGISLTLNAYIIQMRWDKSPSRLVFEERARPDPRYSQSGIFYHQSGRPFFHLVSGDRAATPTSSGLAPDGFITVNRIVKLRGLLDDCYWFA